MSDDPNVPDLALQQQFKALSEQDVLPAGLSARILQAAGAQLESNPPKGADLINFQSAKQQQQQQQQQQQPKPTTIHTQRSSHMIWSTAAAVLLAVGTVFYLNGNAQQQTTPMAAQQQNNTSAISVTPEPTQQTSDLPHFRAMRVAPVEPTTPAIAPSSQAAAVPLVAVQIGAQREQDTRATNSTPLQPSSNIATIDEPTMRMAQHQPRSSVENQEVLQVLDHIRHLQAQGEIEQASRLITEVKRQHQEQAIPYDLQSLLPSAQLSPEN